MGFTSRKSSSKDDTEASDKKQETTCVPVTTEVILKTSIDCCKSCQRNKYFSVLQGLFNIALIVLIIIIFVMINNMKTNIDDRLLPHKRTKRLHEESSARKEYSVGNQGVNHNNNDIKTTASHLKSPKNSTKVSTTKETKFLKKLQILDTEVDPISSFRPYRKSFRRTPSPIFDKPKLKSLMLKNGTKCACIGQQGPEGPQGRTGRRGKKGRKGKDGSKGEPGLQGPIGHRGSPGKAGPRGDVGTIGLPGPQGPKGEKGEMGRASIHDLPVVHVTGYQFVAPLEKMPKGILTNWEVKDGFTIVNGGMKFAQGIMTIKEYGFYHVYSQVFFQADVPKIDPHLVHYVYFFRKHKYSEDTTKYIILRGFATKPEHTAGGQGFYTTGASGVFRLMPGDQLAIGVDPVHMPLISYAESATYFGAYMI